MATQGRVDIAFRYSALGDVVLCSAFIKKHGELNAPLYFVTQESFISLAHKFFPAHSALQIVGEKLEGRLGAWRAMRSGFRLAKLIWEHHRPTEANFYDLHDVPKSRAYALGVWLGFASTPVRIRVLSSNKSSALRQVSIWLGRDLLKPRWIYREHQQLLDHSKHVYSPELRAKLVSPNAKSGKEPHRILLAPAASKWKKEWPAAHWVDLIRLLSKEAGDLQIIVASPPGHALTESVRHEIGDRLERVQWLSELAIDELPGVASTASVCVCSNSAWLHLSEACGVPVVALEGPIVRGFGFSPWRRDSASMEVRDLKCRPCTKHGGGACRLKGADFHACMRRILPAEVLVAIRQRIEA